MQQQLPAFLQNRIPQPQMLPAAVPANPLRFPLAAAPTTPQAPIPISFEEEHSILQDLGSGVLSGIAAAGNFLDVPGSMVRDAVTFNNPFDQLLTPFSHINRATGRDVLSQFGMPENDPNHWELLDFAGFGVELGLDPFFFLPAGAMSRAIKPIAGAVPDSVKSFARPVTEPASRLADATRRHTAALFDTSVKGQTEAHKQMAAREITAAEDLYRPLMNADLEESMSAFYSGDEAIRRVGPEILGELQSRPVVPDHADVFNRATDLQQEAMSELNYDAAYQMMRDFKASPQGRSLSMTARNLHRAGRDHDAIPGFDVIASNLRGDAEEVGTALHGWSNEDIFSALISRHNRPVRDDFMQQAYNEFAEAPVYGGHSATVEDLSLLDEGDVLRPGVAVDINNTHIAKTFGETAEGVENGIPVLDGLPDKSSAFLLEVGSRESKVLLRKGDRFETHSIANSQIFNTEDAAAHVARANDYLEKVSSDLARRGGELSSLDPQSFDTAFEEITGFTADEETAQEIIGVFRGLTQYEADPVRVGAAVQWTSNGVDQFSEPRIIEAIEDGPDGRAYAFMEGEGTGVPLDELTPADGGQVLQSSGPRIGAIKDRQIQEVKDLGGNVNLHTTQRGYKTDHYPRYVPKAIAKELSAAGVSPEVVNHAFGSMKARRPELRDVPTHVIEELLSNKAYRGKSAYKNILDDFGDILDEKFGIEQVEEIDVDDLLFGADELDQIDDAVAAAGGMADDGASGIENHAQALADFVKSNRRNTMFSQMLKKDMDLYIRGAYRTKTSLRGMHNFVNKSAAKTLPEGAKSYTARQVYEAIAEKNGSVDVNGVQRFFERELGVSAEDFDSLRLSAEDAEVALNFSKITDPDKFFDNQVGDFIDTFNKSFKSWVTQIFPAFHTRNHFSGQVANMIFEDVKPAKYAKDYRDSWKLVKAASDGNLTDDQMQLIQEMYRHGVIDLQHAGYGVESIPPSVAASATPQSIVPPAPSFKANTQIQSGDVVRYSGRDDFGRVVSLSDDGSEAVVRFVDPTTKQNSSVTVPVSELTGRRKDFFVGKNEAAETVANSEVPDWLSPITRVPGATSFRTRLQQAFSTGSNAGKLAEFMNRAPLYKHLRDRGMDAAEAARRVERIHFDYSKATPFEAGVAKRVFPFWTFGRRMAELTVRELAGKPGGKLAQTLRATRLSQQSDHGTPDYVASTTSIPLGELEDGTRRYITGFGLAHEDPLSMLTADTHSGMPDVSDTFAELISRSTPLLKAPIEMAAGESFFQRGPMGGRELTDMDPTLGRLLTNVGLREELPSGRANPVISNEFEHIVANTPMARLISTARTLTDPRKYEGGPFPGSMAALNLLTGVRASDISPRAQDAVIRERAQAYARENLGARGYEAIYVPKEEIEKVRETDPERARQMEVVNRLRQIAQKVRERREEGTASPSSAMPPGI